MALSDYFRGMDTSQIFERFDTRGRQMGIRFGPQERLSNSRAALEAGELAKEAGLFEEFHAAIFRAYFTDCRDIGSREVLLDVAREVGLDEAALVAALDAGTYHDRLEETTQKAQAEGITGVPTFLIEGYGSITGAQPIETIRQALRAAQSKE